MNCQLKLFIEHMQSFTIILVCSLLSRPMMTIAVLLKAVKPQIRLKIKQQKTIQSLI